MNVERFELQDFDPGLGPLNKPQKEYENYRADGCDHDRAQQSSADGGAQ